MEENWLHDFLDTLLLYKDETAILDRILFKSREISTAEAGTVFLPDGDDLIFAYTHNDFLFPADSAHKYAYVNMRIPVSPASITGYVAVTRRSLNLPDVHSLPKGVPYCFNDSFDRKTGYRTVSVLTVPIIGHAGLFLGVLQLLNSLDPAGQPRAFSKEMESRVNLLVREIALILENSRNVHSGVRRLLHIANLHDAAETIQHAERVGSLAAEIYQQWAGKRKEDPEQIRHYKSQLRLAAMLHDIGKVGVSDLVLNKDARLDEDERRAMISHTALGYTLFSQEAGDISELAAETALHHHQRWDGTGYGGHPDMPAPAGEDIPLAARITALADVFDSLVSPRGYKKLWSFADAAALISEQAGRHFDPELVESFLEIQELAAAIYERYPG
jgi:hypothetical protein